MNSSFKLYAIYDADGSLSGELSYLFGKLRGTRHCALCDVSHGWNPLGKADWRAAQREAAGIEWLHRDEQPPEFAALTRGKLPAVVIQRASSVEILLGRDELASCQGSYPAFERLLTETLKHKAVI